MIELRQDDYAALSLAARQRIEARYSLPQIAHRYSRFLAQGDRNSTPSIGLSRKPEQPEFGK